MFQVIFCIDSTMYYCNKLATELYCFSETNMLAGEYSQLATFLFVAAVVGHSYHGWSM